MQLGDWLTRWFRTADRSPFPFAATYVINLHDSAARWESVSHVVRRIGLPNVVRWEAVDGRRLDDNTLRTLQSIGVLASDLSRFTPHAVREEIGCALSHLGVLTDIVRRGLNQALILEDDVVPMGSDADWPQRFAHAYADLPRNWEVWFLYRCHDDPERMRRLTPRTVVPHRPFGAAAYAVSRVGAEKLMRGVTPMDRAIDQICAEVLVPAKRVRAYAASPVLFDPGNQPSIINARNPHKDWTVGGITRPPEVGW